MTPEMRVSNTQNLANIKNEATTSFLNIIDTLKAHKTDNIEVYLKEEDKSKIRKYYQYFINELKETYKYIILLFLGLNVLFAYQAVHFDLSFITNNIIIQESLIFLIIYAIMTIVLITYSVEKNIEAFFKDLYPQIDTIKNKSYIALTMLRFLFSETERKQNNFNLFFYGFFVVLASLFFAKTSGAVAVVSSIVWISIVSFHNKKNNVFNFFGKVK